MIYFEYIQNKIKQATIFKELSDSLKDVFMLLLTYTTWCAATRIANLMTQVFKSVQNDQ